MKIELGCLNLDFSNKDTVVSFAIGITLLVIGILALCGKVSPLAGSITAIVAGAVTILYYVSVGKSQDEARDFHIIMATVLIILGSLCLSGHIRPSSLAWTSIAFGATRLVCHKGKLWA